MVNRNTKQLLFIDNLKDIETINDKRTLFGNKNQFRLRPIYCKLIEIIVFICNRNKILDYKDNRSEKRKQILWTH